MELLLETDDRTASGPTPPTTWCWKDSGCLNNGVVQFFFFHPQWFLLTRGGRNPGRYVRRSRTARDPLRDAHQYAPERLVGIRFALAGDAAHTMTLMNGAGHLSTMEDATITSPRAISSK